MSGKDRDRDRGNVQSLFVPTEPEAPTLFSAEADGTDILCDWTAPATGPAPTGYVIEEEVSEGVWATFEDLSGDTDTEAVINDVEPGEYNLRVRAKNAVGLGDPSNEDAVTIEAGPTLPFTDDFNRADTADGASLGDGWTPGTGGNAPAFMQILTNRVEHENGAARVMFRDEDLTGKVSITLEAVMVLDSSAGETNATGFWIGKTYADTTLTDGYAVLWAGDGAGGSIFIVNRYVSGTPTLVDSVAVAGNTVNPLSRRVVITKDGDSVNFESFTDDVSDDVIEDSNAARHTTWTRVGLLGNSSGGTREHYFDDFELDAS
jgi:hypothetical protein